MKTILASFGESWIVAIVCEELSIVFTASDCTCSIELFTHALERQGFHDGIATSHPHQDSLAETGHALSDLRRVPSSQDSVIRVTAIPKCRKQTMTQRIWDCAPSPGSPAPL